MWRSKKYLKWVREQDCIMCSMPADDAHHVIGLRSTCGRPMNGMGTKAPDWAAMPVCRGCHQMIHHNPSHVQEQWEWALVTLGKWMEEQEC